MERRDPPSAATVARPCRGARGGAARARVALLLLSLALPMAGGCRLVHSSGAAPRRLAEARRLSSEGLAAVGQQDYAGAESLLAEAVKRCPSDAEARRHYAAVLWQRGERAAARAQIEEGLRIAPDDGATLLAGARMALEMERLDEAERMADAALRATPRSAEAWHLHGRVALARGLPEDALADFHRGLALDPDDRALLLDAAETYRHLGLPQRALATLARLADCYGPAATPGLVLGLEGLAQESLGRTDEACESYRAALARGGAPPETAARLAQLTAAPAAGGAPTEVSRRSSSVR